MTLNHMRFHNSKTSSVSEAKNGKEPTKYSRRVLKHPNERSLRDLMKTRLINQFHQ